MYRTSPGADPFLPTPGRAEGSRGDTVQYYPASRLKSHVAGQVTPEGFARARFPSQAQPPRGRRAAAAQPAVLPRPPGKSRRFAREH